MMSVKLEDWKTSLSQANYAKNWTAPTDANYPKLCYRVAISMNGLGQHEEAMKVLEEVKNSNDPLIVAEI